MGSRQNMGSTSPTSDGSLLALRRPKVVDFNHADASAVVHSREPIVIRLPEKNPATRSKKTESTFNELKHKR